MAKLLYKKTTLILLTTILSLSTSQKIKFPSQDSNEIYAHSRLHVLPFTKNRKSQTIVQSCSKRKLQKAIKEKIKYDYSGDKNAIAFRVLEEEGKPTDEVMELSFHFGQEVEQWFLKKFDRYLENLKENENLELFYGFDKKRTPVVKKIIKTVFEPSGKEIKYKVYPGKEARLDFFNVNFLIF